MTQPVAPWLPGQSPVAGVNYGRLRLPGVNDQAPPAPYGMMPGQRHVLPEQVNLDQKPVTPENITLDETPPAGPGVLPQTHKVRSFRVTNAKGETVAELPDNPTAGSGNDYYRSQVQKIGDSLVSQAVNPADKEAAARATQFGLSLVGLMPIKDIQTAIVHRYDTDERNSISREVQDAKNKRLAMRGSGGPGLGPTKADMQNHKLSADMWALVNGIVDKDRSATKYAAISEQENSIAEMDRMMSSANSMAQRIAVMEQLKNETGKVAVESERAGITGAAGKWEEIKNKLSLWTSEDPQLSARFVNEFRGMLATQRQYVAEQKEKLGRETAAAVYKETKDQDAADAAYGRMTGRQAQAYVPPHERGAAAQGGAKPSIPKEYLK